MTLSLAAVFIPVLFMGGILGRLLHEFAVTIMTAVLVSGLVSLTLTPMLCSRFVRPPAQAHHGSVYAVTQRFFDGMLHVYERSLRFVLRHRLATLVVTLLVLVATVYLFVKIPKGLLPQRGHRPDLHRHGGRPGRFLRGHARASDGADEPPGSGNTNILNYTSSIGAGGPSASPNSGRMFIRLKPRSTGRPHVDQIIQQLRGQVERRSRDQRLSAEPAAHPHRRHVHQEPVPVHPPGSGPAGTLPLGAGGANQHGCAARLPGRHHRPADHLAAGSWWRSTATKPARWG